MDVIVKFTVCFGEAVKIDLCHADRVNKVIVAHFLLSRQCPATTSQRAKQKFQELDV